MAVSRADCPDVSASHLGRTALPTFHCAYYNMASRLKPIAVRIMTHPPSRHDRGTSRCPDPLSERVISAPEAAVMIAMVKAGASTSERVVATQVTAPPVVMPTAETTPPSRPV